MLTKFHCSNQDKIWYIKAHLWYASTHQILFLSLQHVTSVERKPP